MAEHKEEILKNKRRNTFLIVMLVIGIVIVGIIGVIVFINNKREKRKVGRSTNKG